MELKEGMYIRSKDIVTKEQLIRIKEIERDDLEKNLNLIKQKINKINEEILKIELEEEESSEKDNSI